MQLPKINYSICKNDAGEVESTGRSRSRQELDDPNKLAIPLSNFSNVSERKSSMKSYKSFKIHDETEEKLSQLEKFRNDDKIKRNQYGNSAEVEKRNRTLSFNIG